MFLTDSDRKPAMSREPILGILLGEHTSWRTDYALQNVTVPASHEPKTNYSESRSRANEKRSELTQAEHYPVPYLLFPSSPCSDLLIMYPPLGLETCYMNS